MEFWDAIGVFEHLMYLKLKGQLKSKLFFNVFFKICNNWISNVKWQKFSFCHFIIVLLIDSGTIDLFPYFAMKFLESDAQRVTMSDKFAFFSPVCQ